MFVKMWIPLLLFLGLAAASPVNDYQYDDAYAENYNYDDEDLVNDEVPVVKEKAKTLNMKIQTKPESIVVDLGTTIRLPCMLDKPLPAADDIVILWNRVDSGGDHRMIAMGGNILTDQDRTTVETTEMGSVLTIGVAKAGDAGQYKCSLGIPDRKEEVKHTVSIRAPPIIASSSDSSIEAVKGMDVRMHCDATGSPRPAVVWSRVGKGTMPDGRPELEGEELVLERVTRHQAGVYKCTASNGFGKTVYKDIELRVVYEPEVEAEEVYIHTNTGSEVELVCNVHAVPRATVVWKKAGQVVAEGDRIALVNHKSRHSLVIKSVASEDFGLYTCHAENERGAGQQTVEISGLAGLVDFKSDSQGQEEDSFLVEWTTHSFSPVEEFRLETRVEGGAWSQPQTLPANKDSVYHYAGKLYLSALLPATRYEARVSALNSEGWNRPNNFYFATKGAAPRQERVTAGSSGLTGMSGLYSLCLAIITILYSRPLATFSR